MANGAEDAAADEVLELERARCAAISEQDWDALSALLSDDLTHTHITGVTQDKAAYLAHVQKNPRRVERRDLKVRIYGDVAVVTGPQVNLLESDGGTTEVAIESLQVWTRRDGTWRVVAFASSGQRLG
jgi:ketosteroid isomerase-like protein